MKDEEDKPTEESLAKLLQEIWEKSGKPLPDEKAREIIKKLIED